MSEESTTEQVVEEVIGVISLALSQRKRGLIVVRCTGSREVDHARETLLRADSHFQKKSLPVAQLDPPNLLAFVKHYASPEGPAFFAYGLPKGRDGRVLKRCIEFLSLPDNLSDNIPFQLVLILTLDEIKDVSRHAPNFWRMRDRFVGWPVANASSSFLPAVMRQNVLARQKSSVARRGGAVDVSGAGAANVGGKVSASASVQAGLYDNPVMDGAEYDIGDAGQTPWAGAPFKDGDDIPRYIIDAAPPVGRRWGVTLAPDDPEGAELIDRCRVLLDQHQTEFARQGLAKAAKRFRADNNVAATSECYVLLGRASELRFDHTVALEWYEQANNLYEQLVDDAGISDCSNLIGQLRFMHGDLDGAFSFFDRALRRDEQVGDQLRTASGYRRVGIILEQRKEYNRANALYERAADIERENNDHFALSRSLHHQARVSQLKGRFRDAVELLKKSLSIKEELEDESGKATAYHEMGNLEFRQNNMEEALEAYEKALELEEAQLDLQGIAVTQAQIGLVRKELFHFADAVRSFGIARDLFNRFQSPYAQTLEKALIGAKEMVDGDVYVAMLEEAEEYVGVRLSEG